MRKDILEKENLGRIRKDVQLSTKSKVLGVLVPCVSALVIIYAAMLVRDCRILLSLQVDEYVWGDRLVLEHNIPYEYLEYRVTDTYSLVVLRYKPISSEPYEEGRLIRKDSDKDKLVLDYLMSLSGRFEYVDGQKDTSVMDTEGGDCQAIAIWVAQYLTAAGYDNGLLPLATHVVNWFMMDDVYYRVDVFYSGVTPASLSDVRRIEEAKR